MKIPPDGSLPHITRSGLSSFNNIMIVKVHGETPDEFYHDLATIDPTRGNERWPADDYVESLIPGYKKKVQTENREKEKSELLKVFPSKNFLDRPKKEFQRPRVTNKMRMTPSGGKLKFNKRRWPEKPNQVKHYNVPRKNINIDPWLKKPWECQTSYLTTNPALIQNVDNAAMPIFRTPFNNYVSPNSFQKGKSVGLLGHCPSSSKSFDGNYPGNHSFDSGTYLTNSVPPLWSDPCNSNAPSSWDEPCNSNALLPHSYAMNVESRLNMGNGSNKRRWANNTPRIPSREHFGGQNLRGRRGNFRGSSKSWRRENKE